MEKSPGKLEKSEKEISGISGKIKIFALLRAPGGMYNTMTGSVYAKETLQCLRFGKKERLCQAKTSGMPHGLIALSSGRPQLSAEL